MTTPDTSQDQDTTSDAPPADMTREEAIGLIDSYCDHVRHLKTSDRVTEEFKRDVGALITRLSPDAPDTKVHRWLGWIQGMLEGVGVFTRAQLRHHSKARSLVQGQVQVRILQRLNHKKKLTQDLLDQAVKFRAGDAVVASIQAELASVLLQIEEARNPTTVKERDF